jgi:reticulon-4-interacting protein 1, mitochondrial
LRAVVLREYGAAGSTLAVETGSPVPKPGAGDVLVRMKASSVNPIDVRMSGGYARARLKALGIGLPLRLGRDVAGIVERVGPGVDAFRAGDAVWGLSPSGAQGVFADFALVKADLLVRKPESVGWHAAASMPYATLTSWSALVKDGGLLPGALAGKTALVFGGAGGTGSAGIQLMKLWGARVAATCSTANTETVAALGADIVIDYTKQDFTQMLRDVDIVYDTVGEDEQRALSVLRRGTDAVYTTIVNPVIAITDELGWEAGLKRVNAILGEKTREQKEQHGRRYAWATNKPDREMLRAATDLFAAGKLRMPIERVYPLEEIRAAFARSATNRVRGKLVIDIG